MILVFAKLALIIVELFVKNAAKKAEYMRLIKEKFKMLDDTADESANVKTEYDKAQDRLKKRFEEPPTNTK